MCLLQCDSLKVELQELQVLYDSSQRERAELEEELQRCKAELEKLSGGAQVRGQTWTAFSHTGAGESAETGANNQLSLRFAITTCRAFKGPVCVQDLRADRRVCCNPLRWKMQKRASAGSFSIFPLQNKTWQCNAGPLSRKDHCRAYNSISTWALCHIPAVSVHKLHALDL